MKKKNEKIIYYQDEINDDFADNITKEFYIKDNFKYIHKNIFFRFFSFLLYYFAIFILGIIIRIKFHVKVINKKAIKKIKNTGYFVYGNHTQNITDAFINQTCLFLNKGNIIANNDVYSLKGLNTIVTMLGCLPTPNNMIQAKNFYDAINYLISKKQTIVIFPEKHIWPYYNGIRPFDDLSFFYPSNLNKPIIVSTIVYRPRKNQNKHPYITLVVHDPIYPKSDLSIKENQKYLRDQAYNLMKEDCEKYNSFSYIKYIKKDI